MEKLRVRTFFVAGARGTSWHEAARRGEVSLISIERGHTYTSPLSTQREGYRRKKYAIAAKGHDRRDFEKKELPSGGLCT